MPLYMDRHDVGAQTAEEIAEAHAKDLAIQDQFSARAITYWYDPDREAVFCLIEAPSASAVRDMHRHAHGSIPNQIIEVDQSAVAQFLGRVADPESAAHTPISDSAFRAIMFVDMVSSTDITERLGDAAALEIAKKYRKTVRDALVQHRGKEVDRAGDGFLTSFESAYDAVSCAIAIQRELPQADDSEDDELRPQARIGIGAGEPVLDGDALFGSTINLTARVCDKADAGQIVVTRVVRDLCLGKDLRFETIGPVELKGFESTSDLDLVLWS